MSCAACSSRVEKAVSKVSGVTSCSVSLLTNSMGVEGTASQSEIIAAVEAAGYGASVKGADAGAKKGVAMDEDALKDRETPIMKRRLIASLCFLIPLMYISMGHMMWNWPLPGFLAGNHVAMGLIQLLFTGIIMVINQKFFINGFKGLLHGAPNMDTLVALGSGASFVYSTYALFAMTDAQVKMDMEGVMSYMHEFYFESAAMILTLITVGKMLEAHSKGKTTDALKGLMKLDPQKAVLLIGGEEKEVPVDQVKKGDLFLVKPGENIPVDGIVVKGSSAVNEAALTGESIPVDKAEGDKVSGQMERFRRNIDRILLSGGTPADKERWTEYYHVYQCAIKATKDAYMPNAQRKKEYLRIYEDVARQNEILVGYLAKRQNATVTNALLNATDNRTLHKGGIVRNAMSRWQESRLAVRGSQSGSNGNGEDDNESVNRGK